MKKKSIVCGVIASSVALAATFGGCSLVSSNPAADMNQVVAEVDISKAASFDKELASYSDAVGSSTIIKREMMTYFINYYYTYVQNYDYSYADTFNLILDVLVENAVLVQYSTMYLLMDKATNENSALGYEPNALKEYLEAEENGGEAAKYEYLLGADSKEVLTAEYNLRSTINSAIDSREKEILDEEDSSSGTDTRTAPGGVDTEQEDYFPQKEGADGKIELDYNIYTGYAGYSLDESGAYKKDALDGTSVETRRKAYRRFISGLASSSYDLVDTKVEDLRNVRDLKYIRDEYVTQLEQCVINKYYEIYEDEIDNLLKELDAELEAGKYNLIGSVYQDKLGSQTESYSEESSFSSAIDSMSDTNFVLYAPETENGGKYGFVYNILLPFSETQNDDLKELQARYADSNLDGGYKPEYYVARNNLLKGIKTTDQRAAWFNGETEYAFNAADSGIEYYNNGKNSDWLFFENNISSPDKYEALERYDGRYPYNGTVIEKDDDYLLIPNKLDIDDMLKEFEAYINYVSGCTASTSKTENYGKAIEDDGQNLYKNDKVNGKYLIDYSNFVYASGTVDFGEKKGEAYNRTNLLNKDSAQYKVLSAVNELQYAYTTDTGVLSQYLGYSVQAGDTSYIKEFEHIAHEAVNKGAGTYYVCAGDYGWHLIYVTYTFDEGNQYDPQWAANIDVEGTFENMFYEWFKSSAISNITTTKKDKILTNLKGDATVTKYQSRYQNLLDLDKQ